MLQGRITNRRLLRRAKAALPQVNEATWTFPHSSQPVRRQGSRHLAVVLLQHANGGAHLPGQGVHVQVPVHQAHSGVAVAQ